MPCCKASLSSSLRQIDLKWPPDLMIFKTSQNYRTYGNKWQTYIRHKQEYLCLGEIRDKKGDHTVSYQDKSPMPSQYSRCAVPREAALTR